MATNWIFVEVCTASELEVIYGIITEYLEYDTYV